MSRRTSFPVSVRGKLPQIQIRGVSELRSRSRRALRSASTSTRRPRAGTTTAGTSESVTGMSGEASARSLAPSHASPL
jgi:hypothetical protein